MTLRQDEPTKLVIIGGHRFDKHIIHNLTSANNQVNCPPSGVIKQGPSPANKEIKVLKTES